MTIPAKAPSTVDASVTNFYPARAVAIDASAADVDLSILFTDGFARKIYIGGAGNVAATHLKGGSVTYTAPPVGSFIVGCFVSVQHTGTTATNLIAEGN